MDKKLRYFFIFILSLVNFNIKSASTQKKTIPWEYIWKNDAESVQKAIDEGAPINFHYKRDEDTHCAFHGETPLSASIELNQTEIFNVLLKNNADVNMTDVNDLDNLSKAIVWNHDSKMHVIYNLLLRNVNVNKVWHRQTPLYRAIVENDYKVVDLLLKFKADMNATKLVKETCEEIMNADSKNLSFAKERIQELLIDPKKWQIFKKKYGYKIYSIEL